MQDYYVTDSWYEPDCDPCYECPDCEDHITNIDHAADHLTAVLEMLYGDEQLDTAQLEDHLDEIQSALGMKFKFPAHCPKIERTKSNILNFTSALVTEQAMLQRTQPC